MYRDDKAFMSHLQRFVTGECISALLTPQDINFIKMPGLATNEIEGVLPQAAGLQRFLSRHL